MDVPYPDTVDALEQALREQHVIVHETLGGGDTDGAFDRISELVAELPFAAYVAVVETPDDVDAGIDSGRFLATALSRRIGEPGLYIVDTPDAVMGVRMVGTGWDETTFSLQKSTDAEAVERRSGYQVLSPTVDVEVVLQTASASPPQGADSDYDEVSLADAVVEDLAERERALQPYERPDLDDDDPPEPWSEGKRWMVGTAVGAGLLAALLQSLWGWPGWRRRPGAATKPGGTQPARASAVPEIEQLREDAAAQLTALAESLPAAPAGERLDRATLAREAAEPLLYSDDLLDVVGALVLARAGRREVSIAVGRARSPYRVCFFDPRHSTAGQQVRWRFGDADVEVPVCRPCRRDVEAGRTPETLQEPRRGRSRPYYEGDSVWAETGFGTLTSDLADLAARVTADRRSR